jgi:hypothetical protein
MEKDTGLTVWRGMLCLSLAVGFEEDRARLGLPAAVDRLRDALAFNGLTLDGDERMLAGVLEGSVSSVELAEAICSARAGASDAAISVKRRGSFT